MQTGLSASATYGDIFDAHAKALDVAGFGEHKLNACGYSLVALYHWMDWPMIYAGNPVVVEPNMDTFNPFWSILEDGQPAPRRRRTGMIAKDVDNTHLGVFIGNVVLHADMVVDV